MTLLLSLDPGLNTGIALGYYDDTTPYSLQNRWQVHGGLDGFVDWLDIHSASVGGWDEIVSEKFILSSANRFTPDTTPLLIEGALQAFLWLEDIPANLYWQPNTAKADLIGYPATAKTKAQRQRLRFDFLKEHGLFVPGEDNTDSNDCCVHALVFLRRRGHMPTIRKYWGAAG